jgi:hypothetical protein
MSSTSFMLLDITQAMLSNLSLNQLFQSIAKKPHAYRFAIKFWQKKGATPKIHRQKEPDFGVPFGEVWPTFLHVFKLKTGINWCDRVLKAGTMDKSFFQYWPPVSFFFLCFFSFSYL